MDTQCLAITKLGQQCKLKRNNKLFCSRHIKSKPKYIFLDGGDLFQKIMTYTDEENYYKTYNKLLEYTTNTNEDDTNEDNSTCCKICFEDLSTSPSRIITCSNTKKNHKVCNDCLRGHITCMLNDGIASTDCMIDKSDKCGGHYKEIDIRNSLCNSMDAGAGVDAGAGLGDEMGNDNDLELYNKWSETNIVCEIVKLAGICDNYLICPLCCKWGCIFEAPAGVGGRNAFYIRCGKCNKQWCTLCKREGHGGRSCYELHFQANENTEVQQSVIDKMLQDITTRVLTHCCTICGCTYIKEEGCNLMTCPKCNGMSCYICGMKLYMKNNTKYWHFTGHDLADRDAGCPLWNNQAGDGKTNQGNTEYNMGLVEREFNEFIAANKNNVDNNTCKIIKSRIMKLFGKDKDYHGIITRIVKNTKEN
jgi:hypothetical protein